MGWNCHVCNTQQDNPSNGATPSTGYTFPLGMEEWLRVENDRFQCDLIWMVCPQIRSNTGKTTWIKWFQKLVSHFPHEETQCRVKNTFWICIYIYTHSYPWNIFCNEPFPVRVYNPSPPYFWFYPQCLYV